MLKTKRCPRCSAVVYRLLVDEYDDIKAIECIVCYERWYVNVSDAPAPRNKYKLIQEQVEVKSRKSKRWIGRKDCEMCGDSFTPRKSSRQKTCSEKCRKERARTITTERKSHNL